MPGWLDRPIAGPFSVRGLARGLKEALVDPIAADERRIYEARHANPTMDLIASQHPAYGIPAAIQDIAHGGDPMLEGAGALPFVKGLRGAFGAANEVARQGAKGRRAAGMIKGGAVAIAGTNSAARGQEIMNPGSMPHPYE